MILFIEVNLYRIHQEIKMTYKEACETVDKLCEDWEIRYSHHKLESTAYNLSAKESTERMQELADKVFNKTTNGVLSVGIELSDTTGIYMFDVVIHPRNGHRYEGVSRPWSGTSTRQLTKEQFTRIFFQDIQHVLGRAMMADCIKDLSDLSEIIREIMFAELAMEQNNFFATLQAELAERGEEYRRFAISDRAYIDWGMSIRMAMMDAAAVWFNETPLAPGMKIAVKDMGAHNYSVKILKAVSDSLEFTDGSCIPVFNARFYKTGTWFANNDRYREIAIALGFTEVMDGHFL